MENELLEITNPEFVFKFAGKEYFVRKANLRKMVSYQERVRVLTSEKGPNGEALPGMDAKLVAFCIWLVLKDVDPALTEDYVLDNTPADIDVVKVLTVLGFMSPDQLNQIKKVVR